MFLAFFVPLLNFGVIPAEAYRLDWPMEKWNNLASEYAGHPFDAPFSRACLAVGTSNQVYVTGPSRTGDPSHLDFATLAYNSDGDLVGSRHYNNPTPKNGDDVPTALVLDRLGNVYVTGYSEGIGLDMVTTKISAFSWYGPVRGRSPMPLGRRGSEWVSRYHGGFYYGEGTNDIPSAIALDSQGNVYVAGTSEITLDNKDYILIKYNSRGEEVWLRRYDAWGFDDVALALTLDAQGNIYVSGYSVYFQDGKLDLTTIKYEPDGTQAWVARYATGMDPSNLTLPRIEFPFPKMVAVDQAGNVYVTGMVYQGDEISLNIVTIKYDSFGVKKWDRNYGYAGIDFPIAIALDSGNVYVTGYGIGESGYNDYVTLKYSSAGDPVVPEWPVRYPKRGLSVFGSSDAYPSGMAVDNVGNVYVTGTIDDDMVTVKYDPDGKLMWGGLPLRYPSLSERYLGDDGSYRADALVLGQNRTFYLVGYRDLQELVTVQYYERSGPNPLE
jgi:hypothetical protein